MKEKIAPVIVVPTDQVSADGTMRVAKVLGKTKESVDAVSEVLESLGGIPVGETRKITPSEKEEVTRTLKNSKSFGFGTWNSPWQPPTKKNWGPAPGDPANN